MGNTKLDPRSLTSEERAIVDTEAQRLRDLGPGRLAQPEKVYVCALANMEYFILARRAIFGQPASEPAKVECVLHEEVVRGGPSKWSCETRPAPESEGGKVECPNCGEMVDAHESAQHGDSSQWFCRALKLAKVKCPNCGEREVGQHQARDGGETFYTCKPAQPEPVAAEMPEALRRAINWLRLDPPQGVDVGSGHADALESFWRAHAAQTAKVRMTEELDAVLDYLEEHCDWTDARESGAVHTAAESHHARACIAAVRAQAAEEGKVRMPKVRSYFLSLSMLPEYRNDQGRAFLAEVKAELDAAEGRK